jgi:aminoglycoside phosphotransferase (APT) family kinase protein
MPNQSLSKAGEDARNWIEAQLGTVLEMAPLPGWRPAWNASVRTSSGISELHIRGERSAGQETQPLRLEYDVLRLLELEGIPVPHIHGWCDNPAAIIMDRIAATPFDGGADKNADLLRLVGDYMAIMASVHQIDVQKAVAAGLPYPNGPKSIALAYFGDADRYYSSNRDGSEPLIEFVRKWVFGNIPMHRCNAALLIGDAPQFFHDGDRITHIYDLELAHIGDPMADLASIRVRDINEPIGSMTVLLQRYVAESKTQIDWEALDFHTIASFLAVPMRIRSIVRTQANLPAYVEYLSWNLGCTRAALELLAEKHGVELAPVADILPLETPLSNVFANLFASCADLPPATGRLREPPALSLARYLKQRDAIGDEIARLDRLEAEELLGRPLAAARDMEDALEVFVLEAGPDMNARLIGLFHRRTMRALQTLRGYPAPIVDRAPSPIDRRAVLAPKSPIMDQ